MKQIITKGTIKVKDKLNIKYSICDIEYIANEDETYVYVFKPKYNIIELTNDSFFQGIPGLNLELKKNKYVRENMTPVFISERCPMPSRENYYEELEEVGMDYYNPLLWLIKTNLSYSGDKLFVEEFNDIENIEIKDVDLKRSINLNIKKILEYICSGYDIKINDTLINDSNRKEIYTLLLTLYKNSYYFVKENTNKVGRKNADIDLLMFYEIYEKYKNKIITIDDATEKLNISRATFFRLAKKYQK